MKLPWKVYVLVAVWLIVVWLALRSTLAADPAVSRYFPLEKGNYWVYQGETKWVEQAERKKKLEIKSAVLTWKMEVIDTISGNGWTAALLKGFPGDLAWYEPGIERGDHLIVQMGAGAYYLFHEADARDIWSQLKSGKPLQSGMVTQESLFFTAPLAKGKVFGGSRANIKRGLYCWVVKGERSFDPRRFPTAPVIQPARDFTLVYATVPDDTTIDFVPGLGIVGYQYRHHGTTAETNLGLIEFGTAKPAVSTPSPSTPAASPSPSANPG